MAANYWVSHLSGRRLSAGISAYVQLAGRPTINSINRRSCDLAPPPVNSGVAVIRLYLVGVLHEAFRSAERFH